MSTLIAPDGALRQLSISQVEKADPKQTGGCLRRWWFETANGLKPEQDYVKNEGTAGHELLRRFLLSGERPQGRVLMGKAVTGVILKGDLPAPGDDLIVEKRFSGQDMRDESRCECGHGPEVHTGKKTACEHDPLQLGALRSCTCDSFRPAWVPLDVSQTLHLAGVPWDGAIDLTYRRGDRPVVLDHKFSSDPDLWAKKPSELIKTVQMPVYAHSQRPYWPDAREFELVHHYVSKKGVYSFMRRAVVTVEQIDERIADVEQVVGRMRAHASALDQDDVPANANEATCGAWRGCPHQNVCSAFRKRNTTPTGATPMALSEKEMEIFASIDGVTSTAPAAETDELPPLEDPPAEVDEVAALKAKLEAAQKAQTEKAAKRHMKITDTDAAGSVPPPPAPAAEEPGPVCKCGEKLTPENGSKLQSGEWKHIGCKLDQAPAPEPKPRAAKKAAAPPPPPPPAPTRVPGESASERAATAALPSHATPPKPAPKADEAVAPVAPDPKLEGVPVAHVALGRTPATREALAALLENLATLVRSAA